MIRHPNFSGMQMNQVTRDYTPARYINKVAVTRRRPDGLDHGRRHLDRLEPGDQFRRCMPERQADQGRGHATTRTAAGSTASPRRARATERACRRRIA